MKLFRVVKEWDSRQKDASPGERTRMNEYYAAKNMDAVWDYLYVDRMDEGIDILAVIEEAPNVCVLEPIKPPLEVMPSGDYQDWGENA